MTPALTGAMLPINVKNGVFYPVLYPIEKNNV
jgi:hypothetical protein